MSFKYQSTTTRRRFMQHTAMALGVLGMGSLRLEGQDTPVRKNALTSSGGATPELDKYSRAVGLMKDLPISDLRNWTNQARIHFDHCPHTNWWFLPWHRAYVFYFEQVCRDVLKDPSFALPYWDWTAMPKFPESFRNSSSPLYIDGRNNGGNITISSESNGRVVINRVLNQTVLQQIFSGQASTQRGSSTQGLLEGTPHNNVHRQVGGQMATYMSPLDPIFWMHHCNIDRIWQSWAALHNNQAPGEQKWKELSLARFYDPVSKRQVDVPTPDTLNATRFNAVYDRLETPSAARFLLSKHPEAFVGSAGELTPEEATHVTEATVGATLTKPIGLGTAATFRLDPTPKLKGLVRETMGNLQATNAAAASELFLLVGDIPLPPESITALRIFLNTTNPTLDTSLDDPGYVGTFSLFGDRSPQHAHNSSFLIDLRSNLPELQKASRYSPDTPLDVSILPIDANDLNLVRAGTTVRPRKIELVGLS